MGGRWIAYIDRVQAAVNVSIRTEVAPDVSHLTHNVHVLGSARYAQRSSDVRSGSIAYIDNL